MFGCYALYNNPKMRIAVVQMHYPKGHRRLDQEYVRILSSSHELVIVDDGEYFSKSFCSEIGAERFRVHPLKVKRLEFMRRVMHYINLSVILLTLKFHRKDYDVLLFLNIHNSLYLYDKLLPKRKIVIFHHQDIDDMIAYPLYYKHFIKVKDNYSHICLADFISEGLISETGVSPNNVYTVYQPLVFDEVRNKGEKKEDLLIGIGNSTDEIVIDQLIELDMKSQVCQTRNQIIMRSKCRQYNGSHLNVITGFLSREDYESLYNRAKVSIVTYPQQYKLRYSGIIDDSLAKGLVVFSNDNPCARYFASKYPSNVFVYKSTSELWSLSIMDIPESNNDEQNSFIEAHSTTNVMHQLNCAVNS